MNFIKSFGQFWYDFIIGDDWKIAVAMVIAVGLTIGALKLDLFGDTGLCILGAVLVIACFAVSLVIDVRPRSKS